MTPIENAYGQLFSVGILWISVHCSGMCGPLLIGLDVTGTGCGCSPQAGMVNILRYQFGRILTYSVLGALFGLLGAGLQHGLTKAGGFMSVGFGALMLCYSALKFLRRGQRTSGATGADPFTGLILKLARPLVGQRSGLHTMALGMVMGLLPCMITMWALSLAALSASPLHGALIMILLVAMTTPMLLGVTLLPRLLGQRLQKWRAILPQVLMAVSGLWLFMAGGAGLGWFPHAHFGFQLFGRDFAMMFW